MHLSSVVCSVAWPLNGSEAGGDLVLIQTSLLFFCVSEVVLMLTSWHLNEKAKRSIKGRSTPASLAFEIQVTEDTTVKCFIVLLHVERKACSFH